MFTIKQTHTLFFYNSIDIGWLTKAGISYFLSLVDIVIYHEGIYRCSLQPSGFPQMAISLKFYIKIFIFSDHIMAVDSPVKREPIEPRGVEPVSHRQNLLALRDQLTRLLANQVYINNKTY